MTQAPATPELVERLRESAQAFRNYPIFTADGDPVRLTVQSDECQQAADALEAQQRELNGRRAQLDEVEQIAGRFLGYPWFKDDQKNFPGATEADGVCIGEHVAETIVEELRARAEAQQARIAELEFIVARFDRIHANAEAAQSLADRYEKALREIANYGEGVQGIAMARVVARQALSSQGRREGEQDSSSRSQPCADAQERSPGSLHSGGIDDDCPHAGTFRYCAECPVSPCPLGLGRGDNQ